MRAVEVYDALTAAATAAANPKWKVKFSYVVRQDRGRRWLEHRYFHGDCVLTSAHVRKFIEKEGFFTIGVRVGHGASRYCLHCGEKVG